jgi:hypothetical protein
MVVLSGRSSRSTAPREAHLPTSFGLKFTHHPVNVFYLSQRWTLSRRRNTLANCELKRLVTVNKNFRCLSRVYVRISRFPKIIRMEISLIRGNLKAPLAEEFNAPTHSLDQFILPCIFADEVCSALKIKRGSAGMVVNTIGQSVGQEAITFQSLWAPAAEYFLEVSATCRFRKLDSGVSMV